MSVWGPVYVSPLSGGADGVAEALCVTPHPPQTAAGEQTLHRELHGDADREVDEFPLPRESGECVQAQSDSVIENRQNMMPRRRGSPLRKATKCVCVGILLASPNLHNPLTL